MKTLTFFAFLICSTAFAQKGTKVLDYTQSPGSCVDTPYSPAYKITERFYHCGGFGKGIFHVLIEDDGVENLVIRESSTGCDNKYELEYVNGNFRELIGSDLDFNKFKFEKKKGVYPFFSGDRKTRAYVARYKSDEGEYKYAAIRFSDWSKKFSYFGVFDSFEIATKELNEYYAEFL